MRNLTQWSCTVAFALCCSIATAGAPKTTAPSPNQATAARTLKSVLQDETKGESGDRVRRLKAVSRNAPDYAPAHWQSGKINIKGKWVGFDEIVDRTIEHNLTQQYLTLRAKTKPTIRGHLQLAEWCRKHGMTDRRRAHLMGVLVLAPNHAAVRNALGYVQVGAEWVERGELVKRRQEAVAARKNLQFWLPRINAIRTALLSKNKRRSSKATEQLSTIDKPAAADSIELGLGWHSPHLAPYAITRLAKIDHPNSTVSLARLAVASPWKSVRDAATKELKKRSFHHFVPQVLSVTRTPVRSRRMLFMRPNGSLFYRHAFYQEGRNTGRLTVADHAHHVVNAVHRLHRRDRFPTDGSQPGPDIRQTDSLNSRTRARQRGFNDAERTTAEIVQRRTAAVQEENRRANEVNQRVRTLLTTISGTEFGKNPKEMWDWWESYAEIRKTGPKPIDYRYYRTNTYQVNNSYDIDLSTAPPPPPPGSGSCLAAGTPVWTERGLIAIDKIRIGDRVLSKNIETGELAYKPVLNTTIGKAVPLIKLEIGNRTITTTPGHPFWISGRGWTQSQNVRKGMSMHDVTGTTAVRPAGKGPTAKTYNLIVADYHTYFVGEAKVLSHDISPIEPTSALVPGLVRR